MKIFKYIIVLALAVSSAFASSEWLNLSDPFPIRSAARFGKGVFVATDGGIRFRSLDQDIVYASAAGLETCAFYSIATSNRGVFAVSEFGLVAVLNDDMNSWTVLNRSFISKGVRALPDQIAIASNIIVIGFEDRLAFFDMNSFSYLVTLTRLGSDLLSISPIQDMAIRGDSLYVSLETGVYSRKMDWEKLASDMRLVDPESWTKNSASIRDSVFPAIDSILVMPKDADTVHVKWQFAMDGGEAYFVSSDAIVHLADSKYEKLGLKVTSVPDGIYEFNPAATGGVLAATRNGLIAFSAGYVWGFITDAGLGSGNIYDAYSQKLKVLSSSADGHVFYHVWGAGFGLYSDWGQKLEQVFGPGQGYCMDEYVDNFTIAASTVVAPDSSGFLTVTGSMKGYSLVFVSMDGEMSCINNVGDVNMSGPIAARMSDDGSEWIIYVGTRAAASAQASGGLDIYHVSLPSKTGGRLVVADQKSYSGLENNTPIDMKLDVKNDLLWIVTCSALGYYDFEQDTVKQVKSTKGLQGASFTAVDVDVQGNVWVGTETQGAYRLHRSHTSPDSLIATHYTSKNGMLSNDVSDLAIDPVLGMVWFSHEKGVSRYLRNDLRDASSFMTDSAKVGVKAYPIPFRIGVHQHLTIDNIAEDATVSIFNRGGSLVRFFRNEDVLGGKVDWDGTGSNGKHVTPGVYYYVVKNSSEVKKGKLIIIR